MGTGNDDDPNASLAESTGIPGKIIQLDENVVNRIAAGEVVVRPANALKEMLENSLDAGSKHITISLKGGGLKTLRIEDDGHGIREGDLPILCERFTTSKLRKYEDLNSIGTFGFRGEALASISHVAHVSVTTMTATDTMARVAHYSAGNLRCPPKPCAGTRGTTIIVEDMFYNNPTRRQALGKDSVEHAKTLDVVQKYSLHYPKVSFTCRKLGGNVAELHTFGGDSSTKDVVSTVHGMSVSSQLFSFECESDDPKFSCRGMATGPQWTSRGMCMTLFINNRLVECAALKRAVENVYSSVLPRHHHPWIYLALDLDPAAVDVNVHPTKGLVQFLHEEEISQRVQDAIAAKLREKAGSRTFDAQTSLVYPAFSATKSSWPQTLKPIGRSEAIGNIGPTSNAELRTGSTGNLDIRNTPPKTLSIESLSDLAAGGPGLVSADTVQTPPTTLSMESLSALAAGKPIVREANTEPPPTDAIVAIGNDSTAASTPLHRSSNPVRVRTDHRQRSLESIWRDAKGSNEADGKALVPLPAPETDGNGADVEGGALVSSAGNESEERLVAFQDAQQLTSICQLRVGASILCDDKDFSLSLNQSVYVGSASRELAILQCGSALCMANVSIMAREFAYQRLLRLFGGIGRIALREPLPLLDLLRLGIMDPGSGYDPAKHSEVDVPALAAKFLELLTEQTEMLEEYLMIHIRDGQLVAVPNALGLTSDVGLRWDELPLFLVRLCAEINWEQEKTCFEGLCRLVADFCVEIILPSPEETKQELDTALVGDVAQALDANALNAAVDAGDFEDVAAAAVAAKAKRARKNGVSSSLHGLRILHEAIRADVSFAGVQSACKWPGFYRKDGTLVRLVALEQLYRIFERC